MKKLIDYILSLFTKNKNTYKGKWCSKKVVVISGLHKGESGRVISYSHLNGKMCIMGKSMFMSHEDAVIAL